MVVSKKKNLETLYKPRLIYIPQNFREPIAIVKTQKSNKRLEKKRMKLNKNIYYTYMFYYTLIKIWLRTKKLLPIYRKEKVKNKKVIEIEKYDMKQ